MGQPAARIFDMHVCPMVTGTVPHVGGPVTGPSVANVLIGGLPAAVVGDMCFCTGSPPSVITKGSSGVLIGGLPAARKGDLTSHGGIISTGLETVLIGDTQQVQPSISSIASSTLGSQSKSGGSGFAAMTVAGVPEELLAADAALIEVPIIDMILGAATIYFAVKANSNIENQTESENDAPSKSGDKAVDDVLQDAKPGRKTTGRTQQWVKEGGKDQADKDFDHVIDPETIEPISNGRRGQLPDGTQVNVRENSSDGRPTLEIQKENPIKIRYNE